MRELTLDLNVAGDIASIADSQSINVQLPNCISTLEVLMHFMLSLVSTHLIHFVVKYIDSLPSVDFGTSCSPTSQHWAFVVSPGHLVGSCHFLHSVDYFVLVEEYSN